jgi:hypothetical protein
MPRVQWNDADNQSKLQEAVEGWLNGDALKIGFSLADWADIHGIPKGTLAPYVTKNLKKRKKIGGTAGRPRLLSKQQESLVVDVVRRHDRANKGKSVAEVVDLVQEVGGVDRLQARNAYNRTISRVHKSELTGAIKAQATTTNRTAITIEQQFRWHNLVSSMYADLIRLNAEEGSGQPYDSWKECFVEGVPNNPVRLKRFKEALQLAASLAEISESTQEEEVEKRAQEFAVFREAAPKALEKWRLKNKDFEKVTVLEIQALSKIYYNTTVAKSKKAEVVSVISKLYEKNPKPLDQDEVVDETNTN